MKRVLILMVGVFVVLPCSAEKIDKLGENAQTKLEEIQVDLPSLPSGAKPLEMVLLQPGTFTMGSPTDERGRVASEGKELEWPPHEVTLTKGFYLGKFEVTQAQWEAVMGNNPSTDSSQAQSYGTCGVGDDYPVYSVSWDDCQTFIDNLNGMELGTFRLPTEAEWEYACRAGTDTRFSFGDAPECTYKGDAYKKAGYSELADRYMWWAGNNTYRGNVFGAKEVGLKSANPWGLHDMHGNVYEWCSDWWEYPSDLDPQVDPQGPTSGSDHLLRGGYWLRNAQHCRSAFRGFYSPDNAYNYFVGLRLLREFP